MSDFILVNAINIYQTYYLNTYLSISKLIIYLSNQNQFDDFKIKSKYYLYFNIYFLLIHLSYFLLIIIFYQIFFYRLIIKQLFA